MSVARALAGGPEPSVIFKYYWHLEKVENWKQIEPRNHLSDCSDRDVYERERNHKGIEGFIV